MLEPAVDAFDPARPEFVADPYPVYAALRDHAPVAWYEPGGMWLVARHADVDAVLRDRRFGRVFRPREPLERFAPWNLLNERSMLEMEPPDHTRLRSLVAKAFTPRRVERLRARVHALTNAFADPLGDGEADLIATLAEPLPVAVIAELLGVPEADRHLLRPWSNAIVALYELASDEAAADSAVTAAREFDAYVRALLQVRRQRPGDDLLSALVAVRDAGDRLTEDELVATAVLLLNAGHEASVNVIGNGVGALLVHAGEWARLRADPGLVQPAAEEVIRFDTPLSLFQRTAFADVEVGGQTLHAGERVGLLLGSANRDPHAFSAPDRLDVGRRPNPHVGFGAGIHFCLGAPLARVEIQEVLRVLVTRFPALRLVADPPPRPTFQFRGFTELRVAA
jgi:cytochrome P450